MKAVAKKNVARFQPKLSPRLPNRPEPIELDLHELLSGKRYADGLIDGRVLSGFRGSGLDIERTLFREVDLEKSHISKLELTDVRLDRCNVSNSNWHESVTFRAEFRACRITGIDLTRSSIRHVLFEGCSLDLANLRFSSFKDVYFKNCFLADTDFQGADLRGVVFSECDLTRAQLSGAKLEGADLRGSIIEGIGIKPEDMSGLVVDDPQFGILSRYLAKQFGLVVQSINADNS